MATKKNPDKPPLTSPTDFLNPVSAIARLTAIIESAPTALVMIDAAGAIVLVNAETEKLFGYTRPELLGQSVERLVPHQFSSAHPRLRAEFFTAPETRRMGAGRDLFGLRKDGTEFPVEIGLNPIQTDEGLFVLGVIVDITERKRDEAALRQSEERVRLIVESALDAVVTMNEDGRITGWNPQAEAIFGWRLDEALGQRLADLIVPEKHRAAHQQGLAHFLVTGQGSVLNKRLELTALRRGSYEFPVELTIAAIQIGDHFEFSAFIRDITERKRLADRFRATVESAPMAMIMIDSVGAMVLVNAGTEKLFGYNRQELLGRNVEVLVPERFRFRHPQLRTEFFAAAAPEARRMGVGRDLFGLRKDGTEFPVEIGLNPIQTSEGVFVLSAIVDITERKRLEERFRATVESAPTAMVMIDAAGSIVLVNTETEKLFGYQRQELLGQSVEVLVPKRFRTQHPHLRLDFFTAPEARRMGAGRELFGLRKEGTEFPVEIGLNPIETDEGVFVLSAIVDITERKQLEERFRATVESAPTAMVMIDAAGSIVLVNAETEKLFGYQRQELLGQSVEVLVPARFRPQHPQLRQHFFTSPEARRMGAGRELFGLRKDGTEFPVEIGLNPIETAEGVFVLSAIVDITERKRLTVALREAKEQLEERVEQRTAQLAHRTQELERAIEALERSNLELRRFAYVASHDLQTPLRSISGFVQLLHAKYAGQLDEQADDWIRRTVQAIQQMQLLIQDLVAYSSVDSRTRPFQPVSFREVFKEVVARLEASIRDLGAEVTCDELPTIVGDRLQFGQLLENLIGNALKYHGDPPPRIHVSAQRREKEWVFSVRDNGLGIDPKYHEQIFEIFRRLHDRQEYPGTGIGLALARRVVHRHGGQIWLESEPGHGSTFYFTLPRLEG
jgi:PAS domain S-box-containing protein